MASITYARREYSARPAIGHSGQSKSAEHAAHLAPMNPPAIARLGSSSAAALLLPCPKNSAGE